MGRGPSSIKCFIYALKRGGGGRTVHGLAPPAADPEIPALGLPGSSAQLGDRVVHWNRVRPDNTWKSTIWKQQCSLPARKPPPPPAKPKCTPSNLTLK